MPLMAIADIKDKFEEWESYCTVADSAKTPEQILTDKAEDADAEFTEYLAVDDTTITDSMKRHYMNIVRYNCFRVQHGDKSFEHKPQIVVDYERTVKRLAELSKIHGDGTGSGSLSITAKDRLFGANTWFTDREDSDS